MGKTYDRVIELLKIEFEEFKVSKYSFCKKTGINPTSVERYLHGISEPSQASLEKLADYFKVSVSFLRGEGFHYDGKSYRFVCQQCGNPLEVELRDVPDGPGSLATSQTVYVEPCRVCVSEKGHSVKSDPAGPM